MDLSVANQSVGFDDLDKNIHDHDGKEVSLKKEHSIYSDDESHEGDDESDKNSDDDTEQIGIWGVKYLCPRNVLQSFHCVIGLPPDVLHDREQLYVHVQQQNCAWGAGAGY